MTKTISTVTAKAVKELAESAKKAKAQKEAIRFLVETAKRYLQIKELETNLEAYVKSKSLGKELLEEAKSLTREDVSALEEMIEDRPKNPYLNLLGQSYISVSNC